MTTKKILKNLRLESYDLIKSLDEYKKNVFSDDELLVIIMNYSNLNDGSIFENIGGINNIMLLVNNNTEFTESDLKYKKVLIGYGYKYFGYQRIIKLMYLYMIYLSTKTNLIG